MSAVQPTPFQRDQSPTHAKRLASKIDERAAFLDPLIVVRGEDGRLWTPNGRHPLAAGKALGLKQITVLISPDETLAYRILALNTEKAHIAGAGGFAVRFHKKKKGDDRPPMSLGQALTRMAALAKHLKVESVSSAELAWAAVSADA